MYGRVLSGLAIVLVALAVGALGLVGYLWQANDHTGSLTAASAMATFVLASVAVLTLRQNDKLVRAAIDEATATREQATASAVQATASRETVEEMRREREWAYRPLLTVSERNIRGSELSHTELVVRNIGTGPALNVCLAGHQFIGDPPGHRWLSEYSQGIAPGAELTFGTWLYSDDATTGEPRSDRYRCIVDDLVQVGSEEIVAVRYDDWFGTHYRSGGPTGQATEEYRGHGSVIDAPSWMRCN